LQEEEEEEEEEDSSAAAAASKCFSQKSVNKPRSTQNYVNKRTARNEIVRQTTRQEEREMEQEGKLQSRRTDKEADAKHLEKRREEKNRGDRSTLERSREGAIKRKRQELQGQTNPRNCQQDGNGTSAPEEQTSAREKYSQNFRVLGSWAEQIFLTSKTKFISPV